MKANLKIREMAKQAGIKHWQIAERLGISEPTIVRWLRVPLSPEREKMVVDAIQAIAKEAS